MQRMQKGDLIRGSMMREHAVKEKVIYYKRNECLYRAIDDLSYQGEISRLSVSLSRNAVSMPTEYALSDLSSRAEVQVFVVFYRCLYQSVREG